MSAGHCWRALVTCLARRYSTPSRQSWVNSWNIGSPSRSRLWGGTGLAAPSRQVIPNGFTWSSMVLSARKYLRLLTRTKPRSCRHVQGSVSRQPTRRALIPDPLLERVLRRRRRRMNILASGGEVAIHRLIVSQRRWTHDLVSRITCFDILIRLSDWKWSTSISPDNRNFKNDFSWNRHFWAIPSNSR